MAELLIVATAGHPGAGKTTAVEHLRDEYDFEVVSRRILLQEHAKNNGLPEPRAELEWTALSDAVKEEYGSGWLAELARAKEGKVALDDLDTVGDYHLLTSAAAKGHVRLACVALLAPLKVRYPRIVTPNGVASSEDEAFSREFPEYYSDDEFGVARQSVLDLIPHAMTLEYNTDPKDVMLQHFVALLARSKILRPKGTQESATITL